MGLTMPELSVEAAFALGAPTHDPQVKGPLSTDRAAAALLSGLFSPVALQWTVEIDNGLTAVVRAEVSKDLTMWPPEWVHLTTTRLEDVDGDLRERCLEIKAVDGSLLDSETETSISSLSDETLCTVVAWQARGISQPMCLAQWHDAVCGHHALFNLRCLLCGDFSVLHNEQRFWRQALSDIERLAQHGETSGSWPRLVHLSISAQYLRILESEQAVLQNPDSFSGRLTAYQTNIGRHVCIVDEAMDSYGMGRASICLCFARGAAAVPLTCEWTSTLQQILEGFYQYSAAVVARQDMLQRSDGRCKIYFFDSYNTPLVTVTSNAEIESMVEEQLCVSRLHALDKLKQHPAWAHKPIDHRESAFEQGVEEWWKGIKKASVFWQHKPLDVRRQLMRMDLQLVRDFLRVLADTYCSA
ncbi:unnamed protein product [Symbiodinium natans]|uniref:Uncharacterized protein n=1 Tax=Symbiodinium natans TaxID=878477 RepID=A0A812RZL0_9DINO|nr:unnamed protein product [Symbiodinium natans]